MVKINAVVPEETRDTMKRMASDRKTTIQAVAGLAIEVGLGSIAEMRTQTLRKRLQRDGRRKQS